MDGILRLLESNSRLTTAQLAVMLGREEADVAAAVQQLEKNHIILGYKTVINWDKADKEKVTAFIEVRVTPQRGEGFEKVAERIYQFEEVESLYLMSGGYDFAVMLRGRSMKEVALFVATKLSPIEGVSGTATHFILKRYKENGIICEFETEQQEKAYLL